LVISAGKERENEICYHPFRMTPYLIKVQDPEIAEDQLCCVLLAEKVHSGYEGNPLNAQKYLKISTNKSLKVRAVLCSATGISLWCSTTEFQPI